MMKSNLKVHIVRNPQMFGGDIIIYRDISARKIELLNIDEKGNVVAREIDPVGEVGHIGTPTMRFFYEEDLRGVIAAFMQLGANELGMKMPDANFAAGKLEATQAHLEDMRGIVFSDKKLIKNFGIGDKPNL